MLYWILSIAILIFHSSFRPSPSWASKNFMLSLTRWRFFTSLGDFKICKLCFSKNWLDHLASPTSTIKPLNFFVKRERYSRTCQLCNPKKQNTIFGISHQISISHFDQRFQHKSPVWQSKGISAVECPGCALGDLSRMPIYESMLNWVLKILWRLVVVHLLELLRLVVEDVRHDESRGLGHRGIEWQAWGAESWLDTIRSQRSQTKNNANEPQVHKCRIYTQVLQKKYDIFCGSPFYAPLQLVNFWIFFAPAITAGFKQPPLQGHHKRLSTSNAFEFWSTSLGQFGIGSAHLQLAWSKWNVLLQIQHSNM